MNGFKLVVETSSRGLVAGTLLLLTASTAQANSHDGMNFKEFRQQNPDVARHAARAMFRDLRDTTNGGGRNRLDVPGTEPVINAVPNIDSTAATQAQNLNKHNVVRHMRGQTIQSDQSGKMIRLRSGLDLDLTSSTKNIVLGKNLFGDLDSVVINSGNGTKSLNAGSQVSAAEYIAVKQVLSGDGQKLNLDKSGRATGGAVDLDTISGNNDTMRAANFVVARDVTTSGDFSKRSDFKLLGDLNNYGTVTALSGSAKANSGAIRAEDINNFRGATISSEVGLTLDAKGNLNNEGTIVSTQSLTLTAGRAVNNTGAVSATNDLSLNAPSISNSGTISSTASNVNLNAPADAALVVNNNHGTISASAGAINLRDAAYAGTENSALYGGDLLSKQFNVHAGGGTADVNVYDLTGTVWQTGAATHLKSRTETLSIGDVCLTGDPTFFNTLGSININGTISVGETLVIAAKGNIVTSPNITIAAGTNAAGFDITLIAGADFTNSGGADVPLLNGGTPGGSAGAITLSGKGSQTGGSIILGDTAIVNSRPTNLTGDKSGGTVRMYAFSGKGSNGIESGIIDLSQGSVETGGSGTGSNGSVVLIASNTKPTDGFAIKTGVINTTGGSAAGTGALLATTTGIESSISKTPVIYNADGSLSGSAILSATEKLNKKAGISVLENINVNGNINMTAGNRIELTSDISGGGIVILGAGNAIIEADSVDPIISSNTTLVISSNGNVGSDLDALHVQTPVLGIKADGEIANVLVQGAPGSLTISQALVPKGRLLISASDRDVTGSGDIEAENIRIDGNQLVHFNSLIGGDTVDLVSLAGPITNSTFQSGAFEAPTLKLNATVIGTSAIAPFVLPLNTTHVEARGTNDIFIRGDATKEVSFDAIVTNGQARVTTAGSMTLTPVSGSMTAGSFSINALTGTLDVGVSMFSATTIFLTSQSAKGKMNFDTGVQIITSSMSAGNINILLGPGSVTTTPLPIKNVQFIGTSSITGDGIKAKAPDNFIGGSGATAVNVNNGNKSSSLTLGGGVNILSDPI
jgi:filamentous hemagglutinin